MGWMFELSGWLGFLVFCLKIIGVVGLVALPALYWCYKSIQFIGPDEMGVKVMFGKAVGVFGVDDNYCFVPWLPSALKCYFIRKSTEMYDLDYKITVVTCAGEYRDKNGITSKYGSIEMTASPVAYINMPRERELIVSKDSEKFECYVGQLTSAERAELKNKGEITRGGKVVILEKTHPLIKIVRARVPNTKLALKDWAQEGVTAAVRSAAATMTWREINDNPETLKAQVEENFTKADGALIQAGFRPSGIKIGIQSIELPDTVKQALSGKEAAASVAEKDSEETAGRILRSVARTSGLSVEELQAKLKTDNKLRGKSSVEGGFREAFAYAEDQLKRDRAAGGLTDIRVANADGTSFGEASVGSIVGMIAAGFAAADAGSGKGGRGKKRGGKPGKTTPEDEQKVLDDLENEDE